MKVKEIIASINKLLSNSTSFRLSYKDLKSYIDGAVDYLNENLMTSYKTPQEIYDKDKVYYYLSNSKKHSFVVPDLNTNGLYFDTFSLKLYQDGKEITGKLEYIDALYLNDVKEGYEYQDGVWKLIDDIPDNNILEFDYKPFEDRYIRKCIVYKATALYLEEEDELESQYQIYNNKADEGIVDFKKRYYSCYECRW